MFRRLRRIYAGGLTPAQLQTLAQANQFQASGHCQQAGELFSSLAGELQANQHPRRAANCYAQAAHAYADSQMPDQAESQARRALDIFIQTKMLERAPRFYTNILNKMRQSGMNPSANLIEQEYGQRIQGLPLPGPTTGQNPMPKTAHGRLPSACPKCGAPVNPLDGVWIDRENAECNYCGATLQTDLKIM